MCVGKRERVAVCVGVSRWRGFCVCERGEERGFRWRRGRREGSVREGGVLPVAEKRRRRRRKKEEAPAVGGWLLQPAVCGGGAVQGGGVTAQVGIS